ncbi:putative C-type lectin domain family 20 member A [Polyodon spathula]|uniref:putative C-type lectin domain family 20 member A n=1 Tax=Polyodon spathula TaxID=7913 RepID=UPI001B7EB7E8|nr:putative C-type lectin domain family 20 member A [Polyodon spathula]
MINRKSSLSNAESAVMGERGLLILLLAGLCGPASSQIRKNVFVPITLSWSLAQTYCRAQHTDLVTVRSQDEAKQLLTLSGLSPSDFVWIGLYRDQTQNLKWSNSDAVVYTSWKSGEPNNVFGVENCVIISVRDGLIFSRGEWADVPCAGTLPFFCYDELAAEPTSPTSALVTQDANPSNLLSTAASKDANPSVLLFSPASRDPASSDSSSTAASKDANPSVLLSSPASRDPASSDSSTTAASKNGMATGRVKFIAPRGINLEDPKVSEAILEQVGDIPFQKSKIREHLSKKFPMDSVNMHWRRQDGEIFHKDEEEECSEP